MNETPALTTVDSTEGEVLSIAGNAYRIIIPGTATGGAFAVIEMTVPPNGGPGPHAHAGFQESFYVLEGEIAFRSEAGDYTAAKGSFVSIPPGGMVHAFKNNTESTAKLLCTVVPAGLEEFFRHISPTEATEKMALSEKVTYLKALAQEYGQQIYPPDYLDK